MSFDTLKTFESLSQSSNLAWKTEDYFEWRNSLPERFVSGGIPSDVSPQEWLQQMLLGGLISQSIKVVTELSIPDLLSKGITNISALANQIGADENLLYRLLRGLTALGIFQEIDNKNFVNSELSNCLRADVPASVREFALYRPSEYNVKAWLDIKNTLMARSDSSSSVSDVGLYEYLDDHDDAASNFHKAMSELTKPIARELATFYDFCKYKSIVDVGGGYGQLLIEIFKPESTSDYILFERNSLIDSAERHIERYDLSSHIRVTGGDFFEAIPSNFDIYIMKNILHNWADEEALIILNNCRKAISKTGRLLIIEMLADDTQNSFHSSKWFDIQMMVACGGKERTLGEFEQLLDGSNFLLKGTHAINSCFYVIEAEPV